LLVALGLAACLTAGVQLAGLSFASLVFIGLTDSEAARKDLETVHEAIRPGMEYQEFVRVIEPFHRLSFSCIGPSVPRVPPCQRVHVSGSPLTWALSFELDAEGRVREINSVEYVD
jgi:hypothetical protein